MKNRIYIKSISLYLITVLLVVLWTMVSLEKLWDLDTFYGSLLNQPIPKWWSSILFWLLPLLELSAVLFIVWPKKQKLLHLGMWLSAFLMLSFTIFIGLGAIGVYPKNVCGCSFLIKGLLYNEHLLFNFFFLILSVLGIWLSKPKSESDTPYRSFRKQVQLWLTQRVVSVHHKTRVLITRMRYPMRYGVYRCGRREIYTLLC